VLGLLDFTVYVTNPVYMAQIKTKAESLGQLRTKMDTGLVIEDPSQNRIVIKLEN
jgi:catechol 2,3-dioxygenase